MRCSPVACIGLSAAQTDTILYTIDTTSADGQKHAESVHGTVRICDTNKGFWIYKPLAISILHSKCYCTRTEKSCYTTWTQGSARSLQFSRKQSLEEWQQWTFKAWADATAECLKYWQITVSVSTPAHPTTCACTGGKLRGACTKSVINTGKYACMQILRVTADVQP